MSRVGNFRHRVEFGRYVKGTDQWGDPIDNEWRSICTVWAAVEGLSGRQYFEAQQTIDQSDHRIRIRFRRGIEQGVIARYDGREFTVQAVIDKDGSRRFLELLCREAKPS